MDDNRVVVALQEQNEILSDISKTQKKTRFSVLKVLAVFGLGFALGSASHICRKLHNAVEDTFDEIWKKRKNDIINGVDAKEKEAHADSQE